MSTFSLTQNNLKSYRLTKIDSSEPIVTLPWVLKSGNKLIADGEDLRIAGSNIYWLGTDFNTSDGFAPTTTTLIQPSNWRVTDAFITARLMGFNVIRSHTLGWSVGSTGSLYPVLGGDYDEDVFIAMDYAISEAPKYGLYLIPVLCDEYNYYYGNKSFFGADFYTNTTTRTTYKSYVSQILNRINSYTGIAYKDDPTILAWELGNELTATDAWCSDMAAYIKSVDPNHLVMDTRPANQSISAARLTDANIDIVTCHYWPMSTTVLNNNLSTANLSNKIFIVGEYDWGQGYGVFDLATFLNAMLNASAVRGSIIWGHTAHDETTGWAFNANFYTGSTPIPRDVPIDLMYDVPNLSTATALVRYHCYAMRDITIPSFPLLLSAPVLRANSYQELTWRGVAGAVSYTLEKSDISSTVGFTSIATGLNDGQSTNATGSINRELAKYQLTAGHSWYRIKAINGDGISGPVSNVIESNLSNVIYDTFTDADSTLLTAHTILPTNTPLTSYTALRGTAKISGNKATWNAVDVVKKTVDIVLDSGKSDVIILANFIYDSSGSRTNYLIARATDADNAWKFSFYSNNMYIQQFTSGTGTTRATSAVSLTHNTTYTATIILSGNTIIFKLNNVEISYTSTAYLNNTKHGFGWFNDVTRGVESIDNFTIISL